MVAEAFENLTVGDVLSGGHFGVITVVDPEGQGPVVYVHEAQTAYAYQRGFWSYTPTPSYNTRALWVTSVGGAYDGQTWSLWASTYRDHQHALTFLRDPVKPFVIGADDGR